jgi:hypothetical protein
VTAGIGSRALGFRFLAVSDSFPLIEALAGVPAEPRPRQAELIDAMPGLNQDLPGRQLPLVFRTGRLMRLQPGDRDSPRERRNDYGQLVKGGH